MQIEVAQRLVGPEGAEAISHAEELAGQPPLAVAEQLRRQHDPELAAAALQQLELRGLARAKLGERADQMYFTRDGLEQATRGPVARWRAAELMRRGVRRVADLGCGLGSDALAAAEAGIEVAAVERDPATAVLAEANLSPYGIRVQTGDAVEWAPRLLDDGTALLADPARRGDRGRTWRVADFTPDYQFVLDLLRVHGGVVKFGPGMPYELIPDELDAVWVSDGGAAVEVGLWGGRVESGQRSALALPHEVRLLVDPQAGNETRPLGRYLLEPDPAVIRAGAVDTLAATVEAGRLDPRIAYLTTDQRPATPYGVGFEVMDSFPWKEKTLKHWVREQAIGTLEIKKRGITVDPAALRRRLKLQGPGSATIVITPSSAGAQVAVVQRL